MAKRKTTKKKTVRKKTKTTPAPKAEPTGEKVYFVAEDTRAFLIEYLQRSPAGQYSPADVNAVTQALSNAGHGRIMSKGDSDAS